MTSVINTDDRPTNDRPSDLTCWKNFKWPYFSNQSSNPLPVWF